MDGREEKTNQLHYHVINATTTTNRQLRGERRAQLHERGLGRHFVRSNAPGVLPQRGAAAPRVGARFLRPCVFVSVMIQARCVCPFDLTISRTSSL